MVVNLYECFKVVNSVEWKWKTYSETGPSGHVCYVKAGYIG